MWRTRSTKNTNATTTQKQRGTNDDTQTEEVKPEHDKKQEVERKERNTKKN